MKFKFDGHKVEVTDDGPIRDDVVTKLTLTPLLNCLAEGIEKNNLLSF